MTAPERIAWAVLAVLVLLAFLGLTLMAVTNTQATP